MMFTHLVSSRRLNRAVECCEDDVESVSGSAMMYKSIRQSVTRAVLRVDRIGRSLVDYPLAQAFGWTGATLYAKVRGGG